MTTNKELKIVASIFVVLLVFAIGSLILRINELKKVHIDSFCGVITNLDGSTDSIQVTVSGQDEMSFDFRSNPGKLSLHRCKGEQ